MSFTGSKISVSNSTETALEISGSFTGDWEIVNFYSSITVVAETDQNASLHVDFSIDASNVYKTHLLSPITNTLSEETHTFIPECKFFRVRVINGSVAQTYLRVQTMYDNSGRIALHTQPISSNLSGNEPAINSNSISHGIDGTGTLRRFYCDTDGTLYVSNSTLPTGASTEATLSALNAKVTACDTGNVIIGASPPLSIGACTESTLQSVDGKLNSIMSDTNSLDSKITACNTTGLATESTLGSVDAILSTMDGRIATIDGKITACNTGAIAGTVTCDAGTNLNTSLLALESGGNLATIAGDTTSIDGKITADSNSNLQVVGRMEVGVGSSLSGYTHQRATDEGALINAPRCVSQAFPDGVSNNGELPKSCSGSFVTAPAFNYVFNGTTWDRLRGSTSGLNVVGALTDTELRATAVPITGALTDTQLRASAVPITGALTDTQLRATAVPISGALTDTQLRATAVPVSGSLTCNAGTNLNTSALALETGGNLDDIAGYLGTINASITACNTGNVTVSSCVLPTGASTEGTLSSINDILALHSVSGNLWTNATTTAGENSASIDLRYCKSISIMGLESTASPTLTLFASVDNSNWYNTGMTLMVVAGTDFYQAFNVNFNARYLRVQTNAICSDITVTVAGKM